MNKKLIERADLLQETMKTRGWSEIIYPVIQDMIFQITGGEKDGIFVRGRLNNEITTDKIYRELGYKDALVDFWNTLGSIIYESEKEKQNLNKSNEK